jgi:hypothetical protein
MVVASLSTPTIAAFESLNVAADRIAESMASQCNTDSRTRSGLITVYYPESIASQCNTDSRTMSGLITVYYPKLRSVRPWYRCLVVKTSTILSFVVIISTS